jgi:hypothetical protein
MLDARLVAMVTELLGECNVELAQPALRLVYGGVSFALTVYLRGSTHVVVLGRALATDVSRDFAEQLLIDLQCPIHRLNVETREGVPTLLLSMRLRHASSASIANALSACWTGYGRLQTMGPNDLRAQHVTTPSASTIGVPQGPALWGPRVPPPEPGTRAALRFGIVDDAASAEARRLFDVCRHDLTHAQYMSISLLEWKWSLRMEVVIALNALFDEACGCGGQHGRGNAALHVQTTTPTSDRLKQGLVEASSNVPAESATSQR